MSGAIPTTEVIDPTEYWALSGTARELYALPKEAVTDAHREQFAATVGSIDALGEQICKGASTGTPILDRLVVSGQVIAPERLQEIETVEQMLVVDEPVLLQQSHDWMTGLVVDKHIHFTRVDRQSMWGPISKGQQLVPVRSYVELTLNSSLQVDRDEPLYQTMQVKSVEPDMTPPEAGVSIGLPLERQAWWPFHGEHQIPAGVLEMFDAYMAVARSVDAKGWHSYADAWHVGREAVEVNLGMGLEELLTFVDNAPLREYVGDTRSNSH